MRDSFSLETLFKSLHAGIFFNKFAFFSKLKFSKNYFRNNIRASDSLEPDQARRFVVHTGPNCLRRLSADNNSNQRVNCNFVFTGLGRQYALQFAERGATVVGKADFKVIFINTCIALQMAREV